MMFRYHRLIFSTLLAIPLSTLSADLPIVNIRLIAIAQETVLAESRKGIAENLVDQARQEGLSGQVQLALQKLEAALLIYQELGDRQGEADIYRLQGVLCEFIGDFYKGVEYYQQAISIFQELNNIQGEAVALESLGMAIFRLGQPDVSIEILKASLALYQEAQFLPGISAIYSNLGNVYDSLEEYEEAIKFHQDSLETTRSIDNDRLKRIGQIQPLLGLGSIYNDLGRYEEAIEAYHSALTIQRQPDINDRLGESDSLDAIGTAYSGLEQYQKAIYFYEQSLSIAQSTGSRPQEARTLRNIGLLFYYQEQPELAIIFYKKSVNIQESIRQGLTGFSPHFQESYTQTISSTYRELADLLLQQNRLLEAQQVLDLLKVQELDDYLLGIRGDTLTPGEIEFWHPEQAILDRFNDRQQTAIELGQELTALRQIPEGDRSPTQNQRIDELVQLEQDLNRQFNDFIDSDEILELVSQLSITTQQQTLNLDDVNGLRDDLANLNAVLLYPLILDDRLELVITTPNAPPLRRTVDVSREELNRAILEFREVLQTPTRNAMVPAQTLYHWLIEPLEADLAAADIDTIIYAPDGQLRYIPLAALHDGDRYLIEKYAVNNITARSLTDLDTQPATNPRVLAGAFADERQVYPVQLGQRSVDFRGLPFAGEEVKTLTDRLPNITSFVDDEFSLAAVRSRLNDHDILHFATHAAFVPGIPEDSFILFGDGSKSTLADVRDWSLQNVDLVVLSACQTGLGGFGNGEEILGLGYQFQRAGARAVIASLWQVSDRGTQVLMEAFYTALQNGDSKAEALRRAQQALITGDETTLEGERGVMLETVDTRTGQQIHLHQRRNLNHPYYWAPFILIGNGL
ncbi:MAG: CHAT domain-containing protein [Symploca sp. SIO2B6]|nr:CHAT domain-containing protein [Symploca sp. SIO2B6]